jgi:cell division protein FtsB
MGLRQELLEKYSNELRDLEAAADSDEDVLEDRRRRLREIVDDLQSGILSPAVLEAVAAGARR